MTRDDSGANLDEALDGEWREVGLGGPARRALVEAGLTEVSQLAKLTRTELAALHGMGPSSLKILDALLAERNITFRL